MVKRSWSLTEKLTMGIGLALVISSLVLALAGYIALSRLLEDNLTQRAESQARQLALFSVDAILVYDYATLERYTSELAREPGIISVLIRRNDGELLATAGRVLKRYKFSRIHIVVSSYIMESALSEG